jgi:cell wall-associated NlpC family hydrolase
LPFRSTHLAPLARRTALVLVCLTSAGASAMASPSASAHVHRALAAHAPPKTKAAPKKSTKKKTAAHRASTKKKATHSTERHVAAAELVLPVLPPSLFQQISIDLPPAGMPTMREAFALVPATPLIAASPMTTGAGPLSGFSASAERLLSAMMDRARSQLGTRYVFGGSTPGEGLDCSAFARFAMEALGSAPRCRATARC